MRGGCGGEQPTLSRAGAAAGGAAGLRPASPGAPGDLP